MQVIGAWQKAAAGWLDDTSLSVVPASSQSRNGMLKRLGIARHVRSSPPVTGIRCVSNTFTP